MKGEQNMSFIIDKTVGDNIKTLRLKRNLTQQALAELADVSKQTVSNIELGQGANSKTVTKLAEVLDVSPLALYQRTESKEDIKFKRVSSSSMAYHSSNAYADGFKKITDHIINDTKKQIYYKNIIPAIKAVLNDNRDIIFSKLDVVLDNKSDHFLDELISELLNSIKRSIFNKPDDITDNESI